MVWLSSLYSQIFPVLDHIEIVDTIFTETTNTELFEDCCEFRCPDTKGSVSICDDRFILAVNELAALRITLYCFSSLFSGISYY